jgi:hypothetical protein
MRMIGREKSESALGTIKKQGDLFMVTMNENDYKVLDEKMNHPDKKVICPRCGNEIIYEKRGNSIAVECKTKDCIYGGIRGF